MRVFGIGGHKLQHPLKSLVDSLSQDVWVEDGPIKVGQYPVQSLILAQRLSTRNGICQRQECLTVQER